MFNSNHEFIICFVSYFSYGWTQNLIRSLNRYIPNCQILVIDNNPLKFDSEKRMQSFIGCKDARQRPITKQIVGCEIERAWIKQHNHIISLTTPEKLNHGHAIDMAMKYAHKNGYKTLIHIEPDCIMHGSTWLKNLLSSIDKGFWMAGSYQLETGHLHPTPTAWNVEKTHQMSFSFQKIKEEINDPEFACLYDPSDCIVFWQEVWDTGVKAWYECAKLGKAHKCQAPDFQHLWAKSSSKFPNILYL